MCVLLTQFSSVAQWRLTLCNPMHCSTSGLPVHHQLPEVTQTQSIESVMLSNHLILCHPLLLLPSVFPSIRIFSNESVLHIRWPKYFSALASVLLMNTQDLSPSGWTGWISLQSRGLSRIFSKPQFRSISSSALSFLCGPHPYFMVSPPYLATGKTITLSRRTFVAKVMSLLFNMLSRLVVILPRSKHLLISWLQPPCEVTLEPKKIKFVFTVSPSICYEVMGPDAMILVFWMLSFKPTFSLSPFTFIKRRSSLSAISVVSFAYLKLLIFLPTVLIAACASSSPAFHMMYSAYKLNKQGDSVQPCRAPLPVWNQSVAPCPVSTVASWPVYRFLRRQVRCGLVFSPF